MKKSKSIQISIPEPCHEDWEKMTPCGHGRFCVSCQKTVIDFSTWSDRSLYEFFSKNMAPVCGRFVSTQLEREIQIPHQPMSGLYRIAIACGLTLMFAQVPDVHAMVRQPIEQLSAISNNENADDTSKSGIAIIKGNAIDEHGDPIIGAIVEVYCDSVKRGGAVTDFDGNYEIKPLKPGAYNLVGYFAGYKKVKIDAISTDVEKGAVININFIPSHLEQEMVIGYKAPLIEDKPRNNRKMKK